MGGSAYLATDKKPHFVYVMKDVPISDFMCCQDDMIIEKRIDRFVNEKVISTLFVLDMHGEDGGCGAFMKFASYMKNKGHRVLYNQSISSYQNLIESISGMISCGAVSDDATVYFHGYREGFLDTYNVPFKYTIVASGTGIAHHYENCPCVDKGGCKKLDRKEPLSAKGIEKAIDFIGYLRLD